MLVSWKIPLYKVYWDYDDVDGVTRVIKRGSYWTTGEEIREFEDIVSDYVGVKHAVSFNSGTSALHAVLLAYDIGEGDEVIVPSFTFIATANSVLFVNARPVFADIEEETFGLDPEDIKERISSKTKAIMPIHYAGCPCKIREIKEVADDHNLVLIEDAAESLGAHIHGKRVGSYGDAAMLSFCGNKVITTGEGGMIVTDSDEICEKLKLIRSHGRPEKTSYFASSKTPDYVALGYNWRISSFTAALGISQVKKLEKVVEMRRRNAKYLTIGISRVSGLGPIVPPGGYYHIYQMYTVRVEGGRMVRDELKNFLADKGIMSKVYFEPVHLSYFYRSKFGHDEGELLVTEKLSGEVLTLPMYPTMTLSEMDHIANSLDGFTVSKSLLRVAE